MADPAAGLPEDRDRLRELAADAAARGDVEHHLVRVGPATIRLRVVGPTLGARLVPALAGAEPDADVPVDATITAWATTEAGQSLPPLGFLPRPDGEPRSTYVADEGAGISTWFQPLESAISLFDHRRAEGWYCVREAARLPPWESAAPLRALLRWALADHHLHLVHAAAVGRDGRALLLAGRGGSGKSTSTALAVGAGMATTGDDYVVLHAPPDGPGPLTVHALYRTVKLDAALLAERDPGAASVEAGHGKRAL